MMKIVLKKLVMIIMQERKNNEGAELCIKKTVLG